MFVRSRCCFYGGLCKISSVASRYLSTAPHVSGWDAYHARGLVHPQWTHNVSTYCSKAFSISRRYRVPRAKERSCTHRGFAFVVGLSCVISIRIEAFRFRTQLRLLYTSRSVKLTKAGPIHCVGMLIIDDFGELLHISLLFGVETPFLFKPRTLYSG